MRGARTPDRGRVTIVVKRAGKPVSIDLLVPRADDDTGLARRRRRVLRCRTRVVDVSEPQALNTVSSECPSSFSTRNIIVVSNDTSPADHLRPSRKNSGPVEFSIDLKCYKIQNKIFKSLLKSLQSIAFNLNMLLYFSRLRRCSHLTFNQIVLKRLPFSRSS